MTLKEAYANAFKKFMKQADMSSSDLRKATELGRATIYNLTRPASYPEAETVHKVCPALGITEATLEEEIRKLCPTFGYDTLSQSYQENLQKLSKIDSSDKEFIEKLEALLKVRNPNYKLNINDVPSFGAALDALMTVNQNNNMKE